MFGLFKHNPKIINKKEVIIELTRIVEILNENGHLGQAEAVNKPLQYLLQDNIDDFLKTFKTVDIWRGSGAAWEVGVFSTKQIEREFQNCFIRLAELIKVSGIKFRPADRVASIFKRETGNE